MSEPDRFSQTVPLRKREMMSDLNMFPCPGCQIGQCHSGTATYLRIVNGSLVSVPDAPIWTCDICEFQEFDRDWIIQIEGLLGLSDTGQDAGRSSAKISPIDPSDVTTARRVKP